ncbi:MAG: hypothetical protein CVV44_22550 [Spirochaetae bacterium HGW-Spirochaetae-1]|nr:MAG: hypothetical protein CVV44_22550 [Spirochaetae bacterium HGW-Spirochaetae-1]
MKYSEGSKAPVAECHRHLDTVASPSLDDRWRIEATGEAITENLCQKALSTEELARDPQDVGSVCGATDGENRRGEMPAYAIIK